MMRPTSRRRRLARPNIRERLEGALRAADAIAFARGKVDGLVSMLRGRRQADPAFAARARVGAGGIGPSTPTPPKGALAERYLGGTGLPGRGLAW